MNKIRTLAVSTDQFSDMLIAVATEDTIYDPLKFIEIAENDISSYETLSINKEDISNFYRGSEEENLVASKIWSALLITPNPEYFNKAWMIARTKQCAEKF